MTKTKTRRQHTRRKKKTLQSKKVNLCCSTRWSFLYCKHNAEQKKAAETLLLLLLLLICSAAVELGKSCCTRKQPWRKTHTRPPCLRPPRGGERKRERERESETKLRTRERGNSGTILGNNTFVFPFSSFCSSFALVKTSVGRLSSFDPRCRTGYIPGINDLSLGYLFGYLFITASSWIFQTLITYLDDSIIIQVGYWSLHASTNFL